MPRKSVQLDKPKDLEVSGNGYHGFRSRREFEWFQNHWALRGVSIERPLSTFTDHPPPFYIRVLQQRPGWYNHFVFRGGCNNTLAREFCATLIGVSRYEFRAYLRGIQVILSPSTLSTMLRIPEMTVFQCPFRGGSHAPSSTVVATTLTGRQYPWNGTSPLQKSELTADYRMLWLVLCNCILPTSFTASVNLWAGRILYAIGTGMQVDVLRLIIEAITDPLETSSRYIKCGVIITRLCRAAGVPERASDERKGIRKPIGEQTEHRSTGQGRYKRRAGEASSSQVRESDEDLPDAPEAPVPDPTTTTYSQEQMFIWMREVTESMRRLEAAQARTDERLTSLDSYVRRALPAPASGDSDGDDGGDEEHSSQYGYGSGSSED